jgi:hypothetical protein
MAFIAKQQVEGEMSMGYSSLKTKVSLISKRKPIPAVVFDVLGSYCSVRLSGRGSVLTGVPFSGKAPVKGQSVSIDYTSGSPVARTSDTGNNNTGQIEATGSPQISATPSGGGSSVEHPVTAKYGNMLFRSTWSETVDYLVNDVVLSDDSCLYLALMDSTNVWPNNNPTWWAKFGGQQSSNNFQRRLTADLTLQDGECLVVAGYIDPGEFSIILLGDSQLEMLV